MHKLINYHSITANPDYIYGHIGMAYQLTRKKINTYEEYVSYAQSQGISYYNEELFNDYINSRDKNK